jgi:hypothetical protein
LDHEEGEEGDGGVEEEGEGCRFGDHLYGFCGMNEGERMWCRMRYVEGFVKEIKMGLGSSGVARTVAQLHVIRWS